ncbi:MAG: cytochrome c-type biogenesis CcmF C-terminal domain-containing protein, partial [Candidatus Competibacteraceae bacterium]|nr:cytochrome c-type biogenesis CcmF C-terminal domain-containing protein [Candidatus Competibacteraceae bacterium]
LLSKETLLLLNNVMFTVAAAAVLLGTLYPLIVDALGLGKLSVGPPYFETIFLPLMLPMAFLTGIGPLVHWKRHGWQDLLGKLVLPFALALAGGVFLLLWVNGMPFATGLGLALTLWVAFASLLGVWERVRNKTHPFKALGNIPYGFWGMTLAHLGLAVFIAGVAVVKTYDVERDIKVAPGESIAIGSYQFRFEGVRQIQGPNYTADRGEVRIFEDGKPVSVLYPEKRTYRVQTMPMTESGIDAGLFRDLYVALGEPLASGAWSLRVQVKPLIRWIWLGCLMMALGGALAASDKRYRIQVRESRALRDEALAAGGTA